MKGKILLFSMALFLLTGLSLNAQNAATTGKSLSPSAAVTRSSSSQVRTEASQVSHYQIRKSEIQAGMFELVPAEWSAENIEAVKLLSAGENAVFSYLGMDEQGKRFLVRLKDPAMTAEDALARVESHRNILGQDSRGNSSK